ncbi:hypothetical protein NLU13_1806 [Sarocladium strictum]|uniref:Uncharacterized protein n=1 Tax=Sarocladium strictum TaxID=5046 RepID=A0AA39GRN1_SARSR|nr:hypothetical protein NLU13_1806 [Sarocladium strictum]
MDQLPQELVEAILQQCVAGGTKNNVLSLRLVCRAFNYGLKPYALRTLNLDFTRLNRALGEVRPTFDALQTIGYHCKSLFIDLMVLRDEQEVDFLTTVFARVDSMKKFCDSLHERYCLGEATFTEVEYHRKVEELLFNCRDVERVRLSLPFQLIGRHCNTSTMILANTFKAFASRPEEDSAPLKALVLENVTDIAICHLWVNPMDLQNIMKVLEAVEHLVLGLRLHETDPMKVSLFGGCLWNLIEYAGCLQSLCLTALDHDDRPPRGLKQTKHWQTTVEEWRACSLPIPRINIENLTSLELKRIEICPETLLRAAEDLGTTLEELYLNEVYLKAEQSRDWNADSKKILWIGIPNVRPAPDCQWIAMALRGSLRKLSICRASFLAYDLYLREEIPGHPEFDLIDPCGIGRSVSQRFVEVVMGIHQPNMPNGSPVEFLPADSKQDHLLRSLQERAGALSVTEYDTNAYQSAVCNTTSRWLRSIDGYFPNLNSSTLDELHYIADTACRGMTEVQRRRQEWEAGASIANEYADNLFNLANQEQEQEPDVI